LRHRFIAATAVAALLQHRAANLGPLRFQGIGFVDPQLGSIVTPSQSLNDWRAGFAGRGFIANIDVAIAHDCYPLLNLLQRQLPRKVARGLIGSAAPQFWFTVVRPSASPPEKS
jgi:hypothetical protein